MKLAVCSATMECVAVKIINVVDSSVEEQVRKEVRILDGCSVVLPFEGYSMKLNCH